MLRCWPVAGSGRSRTSFRALGEVPRCKASHMADDPLMREYQALLRRSARPGERTEIVPTHCLDARSARAAVAIVEDDAVLRDVLFDLLQSVGLQVKAYANAMEL